MAAPQIVEIYPNNESQGIILNTKIWVIFNQEVDNETVQILVEGADSDRWSGPDQVVWDNPNSTLDDDVLESPGYKGIVKGGLSFEKIDESGDLISGYDYTGGGSNWRTKATFTPSLPLAANQSYRIYIPGDENSTDLIKTGTSSRTIFDPLKGNNLGNGNIYMSGSYSGSGVDKYNIRIKQDGNAQDGLRFEWWKDSSPLVIRQLYTKQSSQLLSNNVFVRFENDFINGDVFGIVVKPTERMENTYTWIFTTGAGKIVSIPEEVSSSIPVGGFSEGSSPIGGGSSVGLSVVSTYPLERATNLNPDEITEIRIKFNKDLDPDSITDETVEVYTEPVNGIFTGNSIQYEGNIPKVLTVDGDTLIISV